MDEKDKIIAEQAAQLTEQSKQIAILQLRIAKLTKNSQTSSKSPSSDIVKPKKASLPNGEKRKLGGQTGHTRHVRSLLEPSDVDSIVDLPLEDQQCLCGGIYILNVDIQPRIMQQAELKRRGIQVTPLFYWNNHV